MSGTPMLTYHRWHDGDDPTRVVGDRALASVHDVTVRIDSTGSFVVCVTGLMRRRDGSASRMNRCCQVDVAARQPSWLAAIIDDARHRLAAPAPVPGDPQPATDSSA